MRFLVTVSKLHAVSCAKSAACAALFAACLISAAYAAEKQNAPDLCASTESGIAVDDVPRDKKVVLVGEMHGTNELPEIMWQIVCKKIAAGQHVLIALETPSDEQTRISKFLRSDGGAAAKRALFANTFWDPPATALQDGRASKKMFEVLERTRLLKAKGISLNIVAVDTLTDASEMPVPITDDEADGYARDLAMAKNILTRANQYPNHHIVALLGATHAGRTKGNAWNANAKGAGYVLAQLIPIHTIGFRTLKSGMTWNCRGPREKPECKAYPTQTESLEGRGFDQIIDVNSLTASEPAVDSK